jgi:hypothetical protein
MSAEKEFIEKFEKFCFEFYEALINTFYKCTKNKRRVTISSERDLLDANGFSHAVYIEGMRYFKGNLHECTPDNHPAVNLTDRGFPLKWNFSASPGEDRYLMHVSVNLNHPPKSMEKSMDKALKAAMHAVKKLHLCEDIR